MAWGARGYNQEDGLSECPGIVSILLYSHLAGVMPGDLCVKIVHREKLVLPLEVGQAEDDVVGVRDGHTEALEEQVDEV